MEADVLTCGRCGQPIRLSLGDGRQTVDVSAFLSSHRACIAAPQGPADGAEPEVGS